MTAFATVEDLTTRWPGAADSGADLDAVLEDASLWVETMYAVPDQPGEKLAKVLRLTVCAMVKRALLANETEHMQSESKTAGPFTSYRQFRNSEGNFFLTAAEKALLESALSGDGRGRGMMTVEASSW